MKRLTARDGDGKPYFPECYNEDCFGMSERCLECYREKQICEALCRYEDEDEELSEEMERLGFRNEIIEAFAWFFKAIVIIATVFVLSRI